MKSENGVRKLLFQTVVYYITIHLKPEGQKNENY